MSAVIGAWFSSIRRPSSHSEARACVGGKRCRRGCSFLTCEVDEGEWPWMVILVVVVLAAVSLLFLLEEDE